MESSGAYFVSSGGRHIWHRWWLPDGEMRGVVAICHGFAEHSGRYGGVAEYLTGRGYEVEALDLRGHGLSDGPRAYVRSFNEYLNDLGTFLRLVRERHPARPLFLLGHSMGGGIATLYVLARQPQLSGVILSGPALQMGSGSQPLHRRLVFSAMSIFPRLRLPALPAAAVSRDPEVVRAYDEDPLVFRGGPAVGLAKAGMRASARIARDMGLFSLPLLIVHGTDDRLVTTAGSQDLYERAESTDKTIKLYEGLYHEVLNEPERLEVLADIAGWLDERAPGAN